MLNFMSMILFLAIILHITHIQLYVYIVDVYFELIPLGQWLFVFDCNITQWYCNVQTDNLAPLYVVLTGLLLCAVDATITWTLPSPQRGPLGNSDPSVRTTFKDLNGLSPESRLEWDFTLSGESLIRVSWKRGANDIIGSKASSGAVSLLVAFQGHFNISSNNRATLIIYNTTAVDGKEITCIVVTDLRSWNDVISVVIKGECLFCCFTISMYMYIYVYA